MIIVVIIMVIIMVSILMIIMIIMTMIVMKMTMFVYLANIYVANYALLMRFWSPVQSEILVPRIINQSADCELCLAACPILCSADILLSDQEIEVTYTSHHHI